MKLWKKIVITLVILLALTAVAGVITFNVLTYKPTQSAFSYAEQSEEPAVERSDELKAGRGEKQAEKLKDVRVFSALSAGQSRETDPAANIIFYGGAFVDERSYSQLGAQLADTGYNFYLIHSPLNVPFLALAKAQQIIHHYNLKNVYLGGHSLGGVVAAMNASNILSDSSSQSENNSSDKNIEGLIFLASYPPESVDLSNSSLRVLSLTASNDQVLNRSAYDAAKNRLPANTLYKTIEGGNHSGFGLYGQQRGDGMASITAEQQQEQIVQDISEFIAQ